MRMTDSLTQQVWEQVQELRPVHLALRDLVGVFHRSASRQTLAVVGLSKRRRPVVVKGSFLHDLEGLLDASLLLRRADGHRARCPGHVIGHAATFLEQQRGKNVFFKSHTIPLPSPTLKVTLDEHSM